MKSSDMDDPGGETRTIEVEVDEQTARELEELAWGYAINRERLVKRLCEKAAERAH